MKAPVITLEAVGMTYMSGPPWARKIVEAVRSVDLAVRDGETVGLVGESGSGKTTIGHICLGLIRPTRGRVSFEGQPFGRRRRKSGRQSIVLQHPKWSLNPRLRVGISLAEPLVVENRSTRAQRRARVSEMLALVGLEESLADRYPGELSGGQCQRVAIARALITHPRLIVFDEALSALDASVQAQILNLLKQLQTQVEFAALFVSHDLAAVRYVAHRVVVMYAGEVVESAAAERFYERPQHPYSRALQLACGASEDARFTLRDTVGALPSEGCPLHTRCPMAVELCRIEKPALRSVDAGRVACHRAEEIASMRELVLSEVNADLNRRGRADGQ